MAFSSQQVRKLRSRLKPQHVRLREAEGLTLHYLEGWHVVAEANRIFGFDGWDRETVASSCVWTKQVGSRYCAAYVARVRVTVRAGDERIIREGSGAGESSEPTPGQAHERASKAAETDATKRALITFGNCFGLSLYAGALEAERRTARALKGAEKPSRERSLAVSGPGSGALHEGDEASRADGSFEAGSTDGKGPVSAVGAVGEKTCYGQEDPLGTTSNLRTKTVAAKGPQTAGDVRLGTASGNGQVSGNGSPNNGSDGPEHSRIPVAVSHGGQDELQGSVPSYVDMAALQRHDKSDTATLADQNLPPPIVPEEPPASTMAVASLTAFVPLPPANGQRRDPGPRQVIDKSVLTIAEPRRVRDPEHLKYVADQPCIICGRQPCEAHHLRYVQPRALGRKSSDAYTVPLCALHHRELHGRGNEHAWWVAKGRDPLPMADQLWRQTSKQRASGDEIFD